MDVMESIQHEICANCTVNEIKEITEVQTKIFELVSNNGIIGIYALAMVTAKIHGSVNAIMQCERIMNNEQNKTI